MLFCATVCWKQYINNIQLQFDQFTNQVQIRLAQLGNSIPTCVSYSRAAYLIEVQQVSEDLNVMA